MSSINQTYQQQDGLTDRKTDSQTCTCGSLKTNTESKPDNLRHDHALIIWLVGFGFNGPLRQYFSLYRAVSQREGERGKKG